MGLASDEHPWRWYSTNLVGVPAPVLASVAFARHPVPLSIAGARAAHGGLFALLAQSRDLAEAGAMFTHYMQLAFGLHDPPAPDAAQAAARRRPASYLRLLRGWGLDANGAAGAVLKGWVESRFGLVPAFHRAPLLRFPSPAWMAYLEDKASPRWNSHNIHQQLDLLFEYAQWALRRFATLVPAEDGTHLRLWRGSTRVDEQLLCGDLRQRHGTMRLNNVLSFALSAERASCFGDWVLEVRVPLAKLLLVPGLLPGPVLRGEDEVIALGGDYEVSARYAC